MAPLYKAFMSYSHSADDKIAPALQRGIQRLGKPWYRPPVVRVFRDETSLSANPGLWSGIERALEHCEYFLLLASVSSAASPWVQKEVAWWLEHRSVDRFFVVVTDGEITWNSTADDFDWKRTTCLPPLLRGRFRGEPRYVDLRWATGRKILSLRNSRFRAAVVTLAAPLHGRSMEELDGEDTRQRRRFWMTAAAAVAVIGLLAIASAVERRSAQDESRKAESRSMAAKSVELLDKREASIRQFCLRFSRGDCLLPMKRGALWKRSEVLLSMWPRSSDNIRPTGSKAWRSVRRGPLCCWRRGRRRVDHAVANSSRHCGRTADRERSKVRRGVAVLR